MAYPISKLILWSLISPFIKKLEGLDNLPDKPFIIAVNHQSYIDAVILLTIVALYKNKQLCFFATKEKFKGHFWSMLFDHFGAIRVNGSLKKGIRTLHHGKCLGIFPEAGRTLTGKTQAVEHKGLGVLALLTKAPVVPVGLHTFSFWNKHELIPNFRKNIIVRIGKPITFKAKATKKEVHKTIDEIWEEVKSLARISHT